MEPSQKPEQLPSQPQPQPTSPVEQPKKTLPLAIVGLVLAIFLAPVGLVISIIAWHKINKQKAGGLGLAIAGTIIGALFSLPWLLMLWLWIALGGWHSGNQAEKDFKPIDSQMSALGATKLCDNGDGGYGIDNKTPWYQVYYTISNTADLTDKVKSIAAQNGYQLVFNTDFIDRLQGKSDVAPYGGESFNTQSDYLKAQNGDKSLSLTVNRQTQVKLYCSGVANYGKLRDTGNDAILDFSLRLPDTTR